MKLGSLLDALASSAKHRRQDPEAGGAATPLRRQELGSARIKVIRTPKFGCERASAWISIGMARLPQF